MQHTNVRLKTNPSMIKGLEVGNYYTITSDGTFVDNFGNCRYAKDHKWFTEWEQLFKDTPPTLNSHEALNFHKIKAEESKHQEELELAMRFNEGKPELSYIMSMPNAMAGVTAAFAMGAKKYARDNWKKGLDRNQLVDSALRHLMKSQNGEVFDEESGLDHLFHFAWNALVLAEQEGLAKND